MISQQEHHFPGHFSMHGHTQGEVSRIPRETPGMRPSNGYMFRLILRHLVPLFLVNPGVNFERVRQRPDVTAVLEVRQV